MENLAQTKVGKIVATNFRVSTVLTAHNIDFCCGGGITLAQACANQNQDLGTVIKEVEEAIQTKTEQNFLALELDALIDTIIDVHHSYVRATIPALRIYLDKLCKVHGERHSELYEIRELFQETSVALTEHMKKEELILFPYIKAMVESRKSGFVLAKPHFEHINNPINMMEEEHESEGLRFKKIAQLTNGYNCPPDGCQTFKVTYAMLEEFEQDLHKHIHLENNILFPAAQQMFENQGFKDDKYQLLR